MVQDTPDNSVTDKFAAAIRPKNTPFARFRAAVLLLVGIALFVAAAPPAAAHSGSEIGPYALLAHWLSEPQTPLVGQLETIVLTFTRDGVGVAADDVALSAELLFEDSRAPVTMEPAAAPGEYHITFIPTRAGAYAVRLTGRLGDEDVNHIALPEAVADAGSVQFPDPLLSQKTLQDATIALERSVAGSRTLALVGLVTGLVGVLTGVWARFSGRRG